MTHPKTVVIWATEVYDLLEGKPIGGIAVQLYFWAQIFAKKGWAVVSFSENTSTDKRIDGINFKLKKNIRYLNFLLEWYHALYFILKIRPRMIIFRGANRSLYPIALFSKLFRKKLVFFGASDVNFVPGQELVGSETNRWFYQKSLPLISSFVTQNEYQKETLQKYYAKKSLVLSNIWNTVEKVSGLNAPTSDVVWIANLRRLKRAEWFISAARCLPNYRFVMAGGSSDDVYYHEMESLARKIPNLLFLGPVSFFESCHLVSQSRVLVCSSIFEGFPNTFLQAWSNGIPVVSTVDPSDVVVKHQLGIVIKSEKELISSINTLLEDRVLMNNVQRSIISYFSMNHASEVGYSKLICHINE